MIPRFTAAAPAVTVLARRSAATLHRPTIHHNRTLLLSHSLTPCTCQTVRLFANTAPPPPPSPHPPTRTHSTPPTPTPTTSPSASPSESESVLDDALLETQRLVDVTSPSSPPPPSSSVIYTSPFFSAVRRVKLFSLTSCVLSLLSSPIYLLLAPPSIPLSGRIALTTAVVSFSLGTTLALTKITHSYVTRIHLHPTPSSPSPSSTSSSSSSPFLTFETFNLFARPRYQRVRLDQLRPLHNRLITNVRAKGVGVDGKESDSDFYLHVDLIDHPLLRPLAQQLIVLEQENNGGGETTEDKSKPQ